MKLEVQSLKNKVILSVDEVGGGWIVERTKYGEGEWSRLVENTLQGSEGEKHYIPLSKLSLSSPPLFSKTCVVKQKDFIDNIDIGDGLYEYRIVDASIVLPSEEDYVCSQWVRCGEVGAVGYTFGNYHAPSGHWGEVITADDVRYTYLWGTDFKANNGASYTDAQIEYFVKASTDAIARELNIDIVKKRCRCDAQGRGLLSEDYDEDEAYYDFRQGKIERYATIKTRHKPILELHSLRLKGFFGEGDELKSKTVVDKKKGVLKLMERPIVDSNFTRGNIATAILPYGRETFRSHCFYCVDYDAGFENSDSLPSDLREVIGKHSAVSLLNIIGDGLMSGFSSSSLSMDGVSESFSSTQSATSAYFGARIAEYKKDIDSYIKANKKHFSNLVMGMI